MPAVLQEDIMYIPTDTSQAASVTSQAEGSSATASEGRLAFDHGIREIEELLRDGLLRDVLQGFLDLVGAGLGREPAKHELYQDGTWTMFIHVFISGLCG